MLPYYRTPIESIDASHESYIDTITPYKANVKSSISDNSAFAVDNTNVINYALRYPAYAGVDNNVYLQLFSDSSVEWMSYQITERLAGVHPEVRIL